MATALQLLTNVLVAKDMLFEFVSSKVDVSTVDTPMVHMAIVGVTAAFATVMFLRALYGISSHLCSIMTSGVILWAAWGVAVNTGIAEVALSSVMPPPPPPPPPAGWW